MASWWARSPLGLANDDDDDDDDCGGEMILLDTVCNVLAQGGLSAASRGLGAAAARAETALGRVEADVHRLPRRIELVHVPCPEHVRFGQSRDAELRQTGQGGAVSVTHLRRQRNDEQARGALD
ncbi:hypothetical protein THAOC_07217, partial [Thalassiosira oceanica]